MSTIRVSALVAADAEEVWRWIGDFGRWDVWVSQIVSSTLEGGTGRGPVGAVRRLTLADGRRVGERLVAYDQRRPSLVYAFDGQPPFPVRRYEAEVVVEAVTTTDQTVVVWTGDFDAEAAMEGPMAAAFEGLYRGFLHNLAEHLDAVRSPRP